MLTTRIRNLPLPPDTGINRDREREREGIESRGVQECRRGSEREREKCWKKLVVAVVVVVIVSISLIKQQEKLRLYLYTLNESRRLYNDYDFDYLFYII